jgi:hypothetical protein
MMPTQFSARVLARSVVLVCALGFTVLAYGDDAAAPDAKTPPAAPDAKPAPDQTTTAPAATPAASQPAAPEQAVLAEPADAPLIKLVDDFWHYGKIARYDLANEAGKRILALGASPADVLAAFQSVTRDRGDDINSWLLRWEEVDAVKDVSGKLLGVIKQGRDSHRMDVAFIKEQIERLSVNERGYLNGLENLRQSGEIAVPFMVDYLKDSSKAQYHAAIRQAMTDMGRSVLNPLVACTEMKNDPGTLISLIDVMANIGYGDEVPYLAKLAGGQDVAPAVKAAATRALQRMGKGDVATLDTAALFAELGDKYYYGTASIAYDVKNPVAYVWFYSDANGLYKQEVTPAAWGDIMAMRAAEYSLKSNASKPDAVNLWLAADYKREVDLGSAGVDPINKGQPSAAFYGTQAGVSYLNAVVDRAMRDHNAAVALKAIQSLALVAGQANLYNNDVKPLVAALSYPDRQVRFEAALAAATALPQKPFNGQEQVVTVLAEALAQNGSAQAVVLAGTQDAYNKLVAQLKAAGYSAVGGTTPEQAINNSQQAPAIDVIVIDTTSGIDQAMAQRMLTAASANPRLSQLARVFIGASEQANAFSPLAIGNPLVTVTTASEGAQLGPVLQKARNRSGALPLDNDTALAYALRSARAMGKLAISRGQVLNLSDAQPALLAALGDSRPQLAQAAAEVLGLLDSPASQPALLAQSAEDKTSEELKVAFLHAGRTNAVFFGSKLSGEQVESLRKIADTATNPLVKNAAAEFLGALNLPSDQAKTLIVKQSKLN